MLQEGRPLAFLSKALGTKSLGLSTYEKELVAILMAIKKWRHYLQVRPFVFAIKTDHQSLKYLLEQRLTQPIQFINLWVWIIQLSTRKGLTIVWLMHNLEGTKGDG